MIQKIKQKKHYSEPKKTGPAVNSCGKRYFTTRAAAKQYSKYKYKATTGTKYSVYQCKLCSMYHLTTKGPKSCESAKVIGMLNLPCR